MDPARIFAESLTPRPELENSQGHSRPRGTISGSSYVALLKSPPKW